MNKIKVNNELDKINKKNWKLIENEFYNFFEKTQSFNDFLNIMNFGNLTKKEKGDYMELFCKLYFDYNPFYLYDIESTYLYDNIPEHIKHILNIPDVDKGIDLVIKWKDGSYSAVQVKYRSNLNEIIPFGELATFPALAFGIANGFKNGIFFTNCYDICEELKGDRFISILYDDFINIDEELWKLIVKRKIETNNIANLLKPMVEREHQTLILNKLRDHYLKKNQKGRLYSCCGSGKSFMSFKLCLDIKYDKILYIVPSLLLLSATYETWYKESKLNNLDHKFMLIGSDCYIDDFGNELRLDKKECKIKYDLTTNSKQINSFLNENAKVVIISTYSSSNILIDECTKIDYMFDMKILDEAHRSCGPEGKKFTDIVTSNISKNTLAMTATERIYKPKINKKPILENKVLSLDDKNIYGDLLYNYTTRKGILDKQLCDYNIITSIIETETLMEIVNAKKDNNKMNENVNINESESEDDFIEETIEDYELYSDNEYESDDDNINIKNDKVIGEIDSNVIQTNINSIAHLVINSIKKYNLKHVLVFSSRNSNAHNLNKKINKLLEEEKNDPILKDCIPSKYLNGKMNMRKRKKEIKDFENAKISIICSSRIFQEGIDIKICDSVVFADNKNSTIDIVQCVGRCLRITNKMPDKKGHIIIPMIIDKKDITSNKINDIFTLENKQFKKIRKILKAMSTTDENVYEKIIVDVINENVKSNEVNEDINKNNDENIDIEIKDKKNMLDMLSDIELKKIFMLSIFNSCGLDTERASFDRLKKYIKNIDFTKYPNPKKKYFENIEIMKTFELNADKHPYLTYKVYWKGWHDFLGFDESKFVKTIEEWKKIIHELKIDSLDKYYEKCTDRKSVV